MIPPKKLQPSHDSLPVAANLCYEPQHHPKKLVSLSLRNFFQISTNHKDGCVFGCLAAAIHGRIHTTSFL
jgi:hypothetical protein